MAFYPINVGESGSEELPWKDITGVLTAGQTQITLNDLSIAPNSTVDIYTDTFGVNPTNIEIISGQESLVQGTVTQESQLEITVSASSQWDSNYPAWKAFLPDGSSSGWVAGSNDNNIYYQIEFNSPIPLKRITYGGEDSNRQQPIDRVLYSNDGTTWNTCTLTSSVYGDCEISNPVSAKYWRLCYDGNYYYQNKPLMEDTHLYSIGYGVKLTFPVQSENLNVKVRVS